MDRAVPLPPIMPLPPSSAKLLEAEAVSTLLCPLGVRPEPTADSQLITEHLMMDSQK